MRVFQEKLKSLSNAEGDFESNYRLTAISAWCQIIFDLGCEDGEHLSFETREEIHDALEDTDIYLLGLKQVDILKVVVAHLNKVIETLRDSQTVVLANREEALLSHYFSVVQPAVVGHLDSNKEPPTEDEKEQRNTIWISLIFRMLCWLLLHDFDEADLNIVPSDLKGSRMPVFIG